MRYLLLALSIAATIAALSGISSALGQGPVPTPAPTVSQTPPVAPTTTFPVYDGRPCESGTLINDFIVIGDRESQPACVRPFIPDGAEVLYGLSPVPPTLRFRGVERSTVDGVPIISVVYEGLEARSATVAISLQKEALSKPYPVKVLLKLQASEAGFLPAPGLLLEPGAASQAGLWFGPSGLYRMTVETPGMLLDIRDLAPLLTPIDFSALPTPTPGPPSVGNSASEGSRADGVLPVLAPVVAVALTLLFMALRHREKQASKG